MARTVKAKLTNLFEAALYAFVYACFALCFAGGVDRLFTPYSAAAKLPSVLAEVALQAAANAVLAQLIRDVVGSMGIPDLGNDGAHLAASGGGVIFAFLMFSPASHSHDEFREILAGDHPYFHWCRWWQVFSSRQLEEESGFGG